MPTLLLLLALALPAAGSGHYRHSETVYATTPDGQIVRHSVTGEPIAFELRAEWDEWPAVVCMTCRGFYEGPLPRCPVRLAGTVRGRSADGWCDVWDGYRNRTGNHGVRCYETGVDCRKYPLGAMVVVDGWTDRQGRLYVTSVRVIEQ